MRHVDPEVLALVALGEPAADDADRHHLAECRQCREEAASLAATVVTARAVTPADSLVPAPAHVWDRVRAELGLSDDLEPEAAAPGRAAADGAPAAARRRRGATRAPWLLAAAAAGVVVGAAGGALWGVQDREPPPTVVATAGLEPLPGWEAEGQAAVEVAADGSRVLVVSLEGGAGSEGYREVWLIDRGVTRLFSLGVLQGATGRFALPPDVDLGEFPVVDVSDEPYDGDPAHSGDSIIRGVLDA